MRVYTHEWVWFAWVKKETEYPFLKMVVFMFWLNVEKVLEIFFFPEKISNKKFLVLLYVYTSLTHGSFCFS